MAKSVAELMSERQMTLEALVERSGLEPDRVTAIVLGRWTPSPQERQAVAEVFATEPRDITWGHKTPIQHIYGHGPG